MQFQRKRLRNCVFRDCSFDNCDLSLITVLKSSFKDTRFEKSKLVGLDWGKAAWGGKKTSLKAFDFFGCLLNFSSFVGLNLEKIIVQDCIAHDVDFSQADMSKSNLRGSDFTNSRFRQTNLRSADLIGAKNYSIDPGANDIQQAKFSLPEAMSLLFSMDIKIEHENETESER
jgi:fluoroquinolone resistance protein